jgi:glycosyltransferase involved in cell wall biosynthesis
MADLFAHRVLVLHNRYRVAGGEERCVANLIELIPRLGGEVRLLERDSGATSTGGAAMGMLRGGNDPAAVARAVEEFGATLVHAHNIHPTLGFRALEAARAAGAATLLHLHNYRLYCAIGTVYRDGADCTLCAPNNPLAGVRHRCRGSLAESLVYAYGIGRGQRRTLAALDRLVAPVEQLAQNLAAELGRELPVSTLPNWLPDSEFAHASQAGRGEYALFVGRVTREKGVFTAIDAAASSAVPLVVVGDGPDFGEALAYATRRKAPVEFLGRLEGQALVAARMGAAVALLPSLWREVHPFGAIEALAAGLPLLTSDRGGLPAQTEQQFVTRAGDADGLAAKLTELLEDSALRQAAGERALSRARERYSEAAVAPRLAAVYDEAVEARKLAMRSPISSPASS